MLDRTREQLARSPGWRVLARRGTRSLRQPLSDSLLLLSPTRDWCWTLESPAQSRPGDHSLQTVPTARMERTTRRYPWPETSLSLSRAMEGAAAGQFLPAARLRRALVGFHASPRESASPSSLESLGTSDHGKRNDFRYLVMYSKRRGRVVTKSLQHEIFVFDRHLTGGEEQSEQRRVKGWLSAARAMNVKRHKGLRKDMLRCLSRF